MFKVFYDKKQTQAPPQPLDNLLWDEITINDKKALDDLMELWEKGHTDEIEPPNPGDSWSRPVDAPPVDVPFISFFAKEYKPKSRAFPALQETQIFEPLHNRSQMKFNKPNGR